MNLQKKLPENMPEVDFSVSATGITIFSGRFTEPRYLEFDAKGPCSKCKSNAVDINYFITGSGIEIHSSRFSSPKLVFFDLPHSLPDTCFFRVRIKGQSYKIPYIKPAHASIEEPKIEAI